MNQDKRARAIIYEILNLALNRHAHVLSDAGYLRKKKYYDEYGYRDALPLPALKLKQELMAEISDRLAPAIADFIDDRRENMWPMRTSPADQTRSENRDVERTREREQAAEPGATDNPDDAQRLREDH